MELTEIIFYVLLLTGFIFLIVILFSYLLSKSKTNIKPQLKNSYEQKPIKIINHQRFETQNLIRINQISDDNQKERFNNRLPNSVNIIKITSTKSPTLTIEEIEERKKNSINSRYTIVNDKINNIKIKASNFYL